MCMAGDYDPWDAYVRAMPVARTPHRCDECSRTIEPGERYARHKGLIDGRWSTFKECGQCAAAAEWLSEVCDGYLHHAVREDLAEHFGEDGSSLALGRLVVGIHKAWRRPDGTLWSPETVHAWTVEAIDRWYIVLRRRQDWIAARRKFAA